MNDSPLALLERAIEKNLNADFRHVQLATIDTDGHPACRTVVFRHLDTGTERLFFITDQRSHKVAEIRHRPRVEVCWYLPATREQFRLRGEAATVGEQSAPELMQLRADIWDRLSPETRRLFVSPPPGSPLDDTAAPPAPPQAPPADFLLLMLAPDGIDHLALTREPHRRTLYRRTAAQWRRKPLNP